MLNKYKKIKHVDWFVFPLYFFIIFIIYIKYYINNEFPMATDGIGEVAALEFLKDALSGGELPLWNKYLSGGMPIAGNVSMHPFYILSYVLCWLPLKQFVFFYYELHVVLGAYFFFKYLKERKCSDITAIIMGIIYLLSIHLGGYRKQHLTIIVSCCFLPGIMYFFEKYRQKYEFKWLAAMTLMMALQFYGGFLQIVLYTDVFIGCYLLADSIFSKFPLKKIVKNVSGWILMYIGMISLQLIPFMELLLYNNQYSIQGDTYGYFVGYSIHPIKLIQMLFPDFFQDNIGALGAYYSSGLDIELFLGHAVLILFLFFLFYGKKEFNEYFMLVSICVVLMLAAIGQFPVMAKFLSKIPIFGSLRAHSRCLFIFYFLVYVLAAKALDEIVKKDLYKKFFLCSRKLCWIVSCIAFIFLLFVMGLSDWVGLEDNTRLIGIFNDSILDSIIFLWLYVLMLYIFIQIKNNKNFLRYGFCVGMLILNCAEILPYTLCASSFKISNDYNKEMIKMLQNNTAKVYDDVTEISNAYNSVIACNYSSIRKIQAINSYTNFCNPLLYMSLHNKQEAPLNDSGIMMGNKNSYRNLFLQNDLLSMLGVKYIIDSEGYLQNDSVIFETNGTICNQQKIDDIFLDKEQQLIWNEKIQIRPNTFYSIEFLASAENDVDIVVDLYGGDEYDLEETQAGFCVTKEEEKYRFQWFSGDTSIASEPIVLRFVSLEQIKNLSIKQIIISEQNTNSLNSVYQYSGYDDVGPIYENVRAKNIMYATKGIRNINSDFELYNNISGYSLDEYSYIVDTENRDYNSEKVDINDISINVNSVSAETNSQEECFINFAECYYPGWCVYIDGKKEKVEKVNGLIMGAKIPKGKHIVEFKYRPSSVIIGSCVSFFVFILVLFIILKKERHR